MSMEQGYDFGSLYGMADHSGAKPLDPGTYDAVVESAEYGRTKDGTKGAWTIKFRVTTGEKAGSPITMTMSINPSKSDGTPNPQGMGIMFRQLHAMGVPVGPPVGPPEEVPFWQLGWNEPNVAQAITGRPVQLRVGSDSSYDGTPRAKVADIREPRPGAPTQVQQAPQVAQQPAAMPPAYGQQAMQGGFSPMQQPNYGQPQQPGMQPTQPQQQPYGGQQAPAPWQQQVAGHPGYEQPQQPQQPWQQQPNQVPPAQFQPPQQQGYQQAPPTQPAYGGQPGNPGYGYAPPANAGGPQGNPAGAPAPGAPPAQGQYGQPNADWNPAAQQQPNGNGQQPPNQAPQQQGAPDLPPWAQ